MSTNLNAEQIGFFHQYGYLVIRQGLSPSTLAVLLEDCTHWLARVEIDEAVDVGNDLGCVIEPLQWGTLSDKDMSRSQWSTYVMHRNEMVDDFVGSVLGCGLARQVRQLLPGDYPLCLYNEQYIVKGPCQNARSCFDWHQDGQYVALPEQKQIPSIACWCALDDMSLINGTLKIIPYDNASSLSPKQTILLASSSPAWHAWHSRLGAHNTYPLSAETADGAISIVVPAGSVVFMSSQVWHASSANMSGRYRRVYMPQFSSGKIRAGPSGPPLAYALAIPRTLLLSSLGDNHVDHSQANPQYDAVDAINQSPSGTVHTHSAQNNPTQCIKRVSE